MTSEEGGRPLEILGWALCLVSWAAWPRLCGYGVAKGLTYHSRPRAPPTMNSPKPSLVPVLQRALLPRVLGFTLVELLLVIALLATLASIALPMLRGLQEKAAVTEAVADLKMLEGEILAYLATNRELPPDLAAIGRAGTVDPWGNPYQYLPFEVVSGGSSGGSGKGSGKGGGKPKAPTGARKDKFLHPINSDFDLYSTGADGITVAPLTAEESHDDVIRAGNGVYMGLAVEF